MEEVEYMDDEEFEELLKGDNGRSRHNKPKEEYDDPYTRFVYLAAGSREPQDDEERAFLKEVEEMRKRGIGVELPFN